MPCCSPVLVCLCDDLVLCEKSTAVCPLFLPALLETQIVPSVALLKNGDLFPVLKILRGVYLFAAFSPPAVTVVEILLLFF